MKKAKISPLFKKGDKQDIRNYRPIAVLSVFSKILEKIIYNKLLCFLKKFNILTDEQNGFRDNKSIATACHIFIEKIQQALDNNLHAVGIFLDFTKAYDVINHNILLCKLVIWRQRYYKFVVQIIFIWAYAVCLNNTN